jgi:very-short-patch-repair endonuclease
MGEGKYGEFGKFGDPIEQAQIIARAQCPIEAAGRDYTLDFAFLTARTRLAVEIDGGHHYWSPSQIEHDRERDRLLALRGIKTHRFANDEVLRNPRACLDKALAVLGYRKAA